MDDRTGILMGIGILTIVVIDVIFLDTALLTFLGRKLIGLLDYLAFWR